MSDVISFAAIRDGYDKTLQILQDAHMDRMIATERRYVHMVQNIARERTNELQVAYNLLISKLREWLNGTMWSEEVNFTEFFRTVRDEHDGKLNVCLETEAFSTRGFGIINIPHPVHFREGMAVRNKLRDLTGCEWTAIEYDDRWVELVLEAIKE